MGIPCTIIATFLQKAFISFTFTLHERFHLQNTSFTFLKKQKVKKHCVRQYICTYSPMWPPSLGIYHSKFYLETAQQAQFQFSIWKTVSCRSLHPVILRERIQLFIMSPSLWKNISNTITAHAEFISISLCDFSNNLSARNGHFLAQI